MIINHPLLGPRDSSEFVYLGDANLINRPNWKEDSAVRQFVDDRSWLVVTRDTVSHEIKEVRLASDVATEEGR